MCSENLEILTLDGSLAGGGGTIRIVSLIVLNSLLHVELYDLRLHLPPPPPSPLQAPSFYWELEICHLGESSTDAAHIAMGYSPEPQKPPEGQPWSYPTETVLLRRY